jgi:hypothetical protein
MLNKVSKTSKKPVPKATANATILSKNISLQDSPAPGPALHMTSSAVLKVTKVRVAPQTTTAILAMVGKRPLLV